MTATYTRHFDWLSWRTELNPSDKSVYCRIARYSDNFKVNCVSKDRIAHEEGLSLSSVERSVKKLVKLKLISIVKTGRKNSYTVLDHPWMSEEIPAFTLYSDQRDDVDNTRQNEGYALNTRQSDGGTPVNLTDNTRQSDVLREFVRESTKIVEITNSIDTSTGGQVPEILTDQEGTDNTRQNEGCQESAGGEEKITSTLWLVSGDNHHYATLLEMIESNDKRLSLSGKGAEYREHLRTILGKFGVPEEERVPLALRITGATNMKAELISVLSEYQKEMA